MDDLIELVMEIVGDLITDHTSSRGLKILVAVVIAVLLLILVLKT